MISKIKKGFSLVELLVVIAIIGILAAVGITAYSGYTKNAKAKAAMSQFSQVEAIVNAEMDRCAVGEGNYVWTTLVSEDAEGAGPVDDYIRNMGLDPDSPEGEALQVMLLEADIGTPPVFIENVSQVAAAVPCTNFPVGTDIVNYANTTLEMKNPYNGDLDFAVLR